MLPEKLPETWNRDILQGMPRPPKLIRAKRNPRDGRYFVGFLEAPGRWFQSPEEDEEKALAWARRSKGRLLADPGRELHLRSFLDGFFRPGGPWVRRMESKGHRFGEKYLLTRQGHVDNYIEPLFGAADPRELTGRYIDDTILAAKRASGSELPLAPATKYKILYTFHLVLEDLKEQGIIPSNPLEGVKPYSRAPVKPRSALPREALRILFPATHGSLVKVWGSSMWAACMLVLLDSGIRPGELRALRWSELYTGEDPALVVRHGIEAGTLDRVKGTKTDIVRAGSISIRTAQELEIWRAESRHNGPDDFIFTLDGRAPVTNEGIIKAFRRGLEATGMKTASWTPYWLRHSFITYALDSLEDSELLLLAGHTNIVTNAIYRHPDDEVVLQRSRKAREKLRGGKR